MQPVGLFCESTCQPCVCDVHGKVKTVLLARFHNLLA